MSDAARTNDHPARPVGFWRNLAARFAASAFLRRGRALWEQNARDWNYPLSKWDKLWCGAYLIAGDFAAGTFPPRFEDQALAYQNEKDYHTSLPGLNLAQLQRAQITKPFWNAHSSARFLGDFNRLFHFFETRGITPPQRLLELGCGSGWMAEMLAQAGYAVVGTTLAPHDVEIAQKKAEGARCRDPLTELSFVEWPMETVDEMPGARGAFDAVFVYEALHHAFDWRKTLRAAAAVLKRGGRLLIANEPNRLHTFISYRVAKLSHTHEIGFARNALVNELKACGFGEVEISQPTFDNWVTPFWMIARKD
ncbi:MAG TPA: class I SAM-dependent methyltransferase [Chthoniobacteraceae bacterium]|nr:class I SAM-dependent methyltransferase [Chthoniobacteraceae bacterium]